MIKIIHGAGATAEDSALLDRMFQGRAEVFSARLGWDVIVENGR
jgi:N-acyl-L-homoserine lactone synthetase